MAATPPALVDEIRDPILSLAGISGLVLGLTTQPPGTIESEKKSPGRCRRS